MMSVSVLWKVIGDNMMRVTNLILHIMAVILMLPDLLFVGINTLMGLGYFNFGELIMVGVANLVLCAAGLTSSVGEMIQFAKYSSTKPKVYMRRELIGHGLSALWFALAIGYIIAVHLKSSYPHDLGFSMYDNLAGLVLSLVGIIVNVVGGRKKLKSTPVI